MAINPKFPYLFHGGDYSPDQWPDATQVEDVRLMGLARANMMSVAIFSWATLEVRENEFRWDWLDKTFERLGKAGVGIALATPTSSPPRWLTAKHPEIVAVDDMGLRGFPGGRQRFCPTVPVYRDHVARINTLLAQRYGTHAALALCGIL